MSDFYFRQLQVGPAQNFCYLIGDRSKKECIVVDAAWEIDRIVEQAQSEDMNIVGAAVSHFHPDHCGGHLWGHDIEGLAELNAKLHVPIYANKHEIEGLCVVTGLSKSDFKCCESGDDISCGNVHIKTIHTPGHTPGSQCFLVQDSLVSGDTLFLSGCGRVDLPGGNSEQLFESLQNKIKKLPKGTVLYPGHHYDRETHATLERVMAINPYLQVNSLQEWNEIR